MALTMKSATTLNARVAPQQSVRAKRAAPVAALKNDIAKVAKAAGVGVASLGLALSANAATVKLGGDGGALVFDPANVSIKAGESVDWVNNVGFPHNVVFDEDEIPAGANADALSHEEYLNAPGEKVSSKFTTPGKYSYYCEPHVSFNTSRADLCLTPLLQGAGMKGTITVN